MYSPVHCSIRSLILVESNKVMALKELVTVEQSWVGERRLSVAEWEQHREKIIHLYREDGWSAPRIAQALTRHFRLSLQGACIITTRMVRRRLDEWRVPRKNQTEVQKLALHQHLISEVNAGGRPAVDASQLKQLQRWAKSMDDGDRSAQLLEAVLPQLIVTPTQGAQRTRMADTETDSLVEDEDPFEDSELAGVNQIDRRLGEQVNHTPTDVDDSEEQRFSCPNTERNSQGASVIISRSKTNSVILQPSPSCQNIETLFRMTQQFYHRQLVQYTDPRVEAAGKATANLSLDTSDTFWCRINAGIYFLKMRSCHLADRELSLAIQMVPALCASVPYSFLPNLFAVLSPINVSIYPQLRQDILRVFCSGAMSAFGRDHPLTQICGILHAQPPTDDLSMNALQSMVDEMNDCDLQFYPIVFDLQRSMIRLHRRSGRHCAAETSMRRLLVSAQGWDQAGGVSHGESALALTELVHIYHDRKEYARALSTAKEVVRIWRNVLGPQYPDSRAIFALEDVAEMYRLLGHTRLCGRWLQHALHGARNLWGDTSDTKHIEEKLQDVRRKEKLEDALAVANDPVQANQIETSSFVSEVH